MRRRAALLAAALSLGLAARGGTAAPGAALSLTAHRGTGANETDLTWTGATSPTDVFVSASPSGLSTIVNLKGTTAGASWADTSGTGSLFFDVENSAAILYMENFDAGTNSLATFSTSAAVVWYVSAYKSASAPNSLHLGNTFAPYDYADGTHIIGTATTPLIAVPAQGAELDFSLFKWTEGATSWDQFSVEILDASSNVLATFPRYGEYQDPAFTRLHAPVHYAAGGVRIRFRFDTIDPTGNNFPGVYLDDLVVRALPACAGSSGADDAIFDAGSGHCTLQFLAPTSWNGARTNCIAKGGTLAAVTGAAENARIASFGGQETAGTAAAWIGADDIAVEGTFVWDNGEPFAYSNWAAGEPNNSGNNEDCVQTSYAGLWNDLPCGSSLSYLCEAGP